MLNRCSHVMAALTAAAVVAAGCQDTSSSPSAAAVAKLADKDPKVVTEALDSLRKLKAKDAVPQIIPQLKSENGNVREAAAAALEDLGDPQAVQPLIDAYDLATSDKAIVRANSKISDALGTLGDRRATPALLKVLQTRDDLLRVHAVEALGKLKDPSSTPALVRLVSDDGMPPLIVKFAIIALGDIGAPDAIPPLLKALVMERNGISFFVEASYGLFQIGSPAVPALSALVAGTDKEYAAWAESQNRLPGGYVSKAAIVLADIGDPSAIPVLIKALKWEDAGGKEALTNLVRGTVAEALGRLRAADAAAPMSAMYGSVEDARVRGQFGVALAHINDKKVLPKLEAAVKNVKDPWPDRQEAIAALALLGDAKEKPVFDAVQKVETVEKALKECLAEESDDSADAKKEKCQKAADARVKFLADQVALLMVADGCKEDAACWAGKLKDANPKIRERAAYQLGELGSAGSIDALVEACKDQSTYVRRAAYIALDWLTRVDAVKPALKAKYDVLAAQLDAEKSSAITQIVNEDLRRVVWKLHKS